MNEIYWGKKIYTTLIIVLFDMHMLLLLSLFFNITRLFFIIGIFHFWYFFTKNALVGLFFNIWYHNDFIGVILTRQCIIILIIDKLYIDWRNNNIRHWHIINGISRWIVYPYLFVQPCHLSWPLPFPCFILDSSKINYLQSWRSIVMFVIEIWQTKENKNNQFIIPIFFYSFDSKIPRNSFQ